MARDARLSDPKDGGQLADTHLFPAKEREDAEPVPVRKRLEEEFEILHCWILYSRMAIQSTPFDSGDRIPSPSSAV
jgi:hypothetical protein